MKAWFAALSERERRFVTIGGCAAAVIVLLLITLPLSRSAAAIEARVATKRADLAWMRSVAPTLVSAGPVIEAPDTQESLVVIVDRSAREANLGEALARSESSGEGAQRVQFDGASFDVLVAWLARLREQRGIRVVSGNVDRTDEPGIVNAALVLSAR